MILEHGRPGNVQTREAREARTYELLDHIGIEYGRVDHGAAETMEVCREIESTLQAPICKNLFLEDRKNVYSRFTL